MCIWKMDGYIEEQVICLLDWDWKTKRVHCNYGFREDGTPKKDKEGNVKRSFRAPKEDDWSLVKKKTEAEY